MKPSHFFLGLVYLLLLWFVSGLSRTGGMLVFAAGMLVLAFALFALRWSRRPLFVVLVVIINLALIAGSAEGLLRLAPGVLGGWIANHAYGGYHCSPGGIYQRDWQLGHALKPGQACTLFWNGHWWRHTTNAAGYRGGRVARADAVFLGDSMIYGHGVDGDQTVPSQFQSATGQRAVNLGQQGTCLVQMCASYGRTGAALRPQAVFVCSHFNDIGEATYWYAEDELERFLTEEDHEPVVRTQFQPRAWWRFDHHVWDAHLAPSLRMTGALSAAFSLLAGSGSSSRSTASGDERAPAAAKLAEPFAPWDSTAHEQLGWRMHCEALARLKRQCDAQGAQLVLFDIGYPYAFSQAIQDVAKQMQVVYSPAGRIALERALAGDDIFLVNDGHWSENGCRVVARELVKHAP